MSIQYIHTSAKRGLEPGKSGFCCVARDKEIPPDLISEFESQSRYTVDKHGGAPLILRHRIAKLRSGIYHILSRINESGVDYSKRNNHIAHHIAFAQDETSGLPNPAAILLNWRGWRKKWNEPPRILEPFETFDIQDIESFWAANAQSSSFHKVVLGSSASSFVFDVSLQQERKLVEHLRKSINSLPASQRWAYSFTSCLLPTDQPQDYDWSGLLASLPLPYEIDFTSRKLSPDLELVSPVDPYELQKPEPFFEPPEPPQSEPKPEKPEHKQAPIVEIPEAYDHKKRKRPKRRFGRRELLRSINLSILAGALLCGFLIYQLLQSHNTNPLAPTLDDSNGSGVFNLQEQESLWQEFAEKGYPRSELDAIRPTALFLNSIGEDQALRAIAFLKELIAANPEDLENGMAVPVQILKQEGDDFILPLSSIGYPALKQVALLPQALLPTLSELAANSPNQILTPLSGMPEASFSVDSFFQSLNAFLIEAEADYLSLPEATHDAMEQFFEERSELLSNPQYQPSLDVHRSFLTENSQSYLALDGNDRFNPEVPLSFAAYLRGLFLNAVDQSNDPSLQSTPFRAALGQIRRSESEAIMDTVNQVQDAFLLLELDGRASSDPWRRRSLAWDRAFYRSDLMEQTILGYTLEGLEDAKKRLAALRETFTAQDLALRSEHVRRSEEAAALRQEAAEAISQKDWVVISKQSTKVRRKLP